MNHNLIFGMFIPFLGTALGASTVLFMKRSTSVTMKKFLTGFAAGVMIAASIWSLIIPSMEMSGNQPYPSWIPASIGFTGGIIFLLLLDSIIPHQHLGSRESEGIQTTWNKSTKLLFTVMLHNIPEGMAVGTVFAGALQRNSGISLTGAFALTIGIAIQNFPEGAIISLPLREEGMSKTKAFGLGMASGIVEPLAAAATIILAGTVVKILPFLLSFAAGAMIYVVIEELIPESQNGTHSNVGAVGAAIGFVLMMILDVALG